MENYDAIHRVGKVEITHIYDGGSVATFLYWPLAPLASPGASIKKLPQNAPSYMCVRLKHRLLFVT